MTHPEVKIEVRCRRLHYWAAVILNWLHCYKLAYKFTKAKVIRQRDQAQRELGGLKTMQALGLPR
jgi:hypothetical protein